VTGAAQGIGHAIALALRSVEQPRQTLRL